MGGYLMAFLTNTAPFVTQAVTNVTAINTDLFVYDSTLAGNKFKSITFQLVGSSPVGTISFQTSEDNTTWVALAVTPKAGGATVTTATAVGQWIIPILGRYTRVRTTAYTSGTFGGFAYGTESLIMPHNTSQSISGSVTATGIAGTAAHDAAISGNPVRLAGRAVTASYTAVATGDTSDLVTTTQGHLIVKLDTIPENTWNYAPAAGGIVNTTTAVTIKTAAAAGIRNYLKTLTIHTDTLGGATELAVRDGAAGTVLWRGKLQTTATQGCFYFDPPLKGTAATLMEVVTLTAVTGGVYVNASGYIAP
jgi:hypothetical protein